MSPGPAPRPTRPGAPLLVVLLLVSLLVALTVSSVVQDLLPATWPFVARFWVPAVVIALVLMGGQVWAFVAIRRPQDGAR